MTAFVIMIILWVCFGICGIAYDNNEDNLVNYPFVVFMVTVPFIPFIAHWCGLY